MKNTRYFKLFTVIIFTLLSISCSFWNNPQNNKNINDDKFILYGSINFDLSRAALPSIPDGEYYVSASDGNNEIAGSVENGIYSITLERNMAWTVTAGLKSPDSQTIFMIDTWTIPQTNAEAVLSHTFVLKPLTSENGTGGLGLTIVLNNDLDGIVSKVTADCKSANTENWEMSVLPTEENMTFEEDSPLEVTVSQNTIASGQYEVSFNFYNANNILVYNTIQTINIFDNLTTNTWSYGGGSGPIKTDGRFELTKALVDGYSQTHLYVGATAFAATPSDTNANGSATKPFASVTGAVNYLKSVGSDQKDYTIYIVGTVKGSQEIKDDDTSAIPAGSITIEGFTGLNEGMPQDVLDGSDEDPSNTAASVLQIGTTKPVILRNLKITGGLNGISSSDAEIDLTISTGTLITNNENNSGLQVSAGTVTLDGGIISENSGTQGGGVNITGGTFIMTSGSISSNTVASNGNGNGVYVAAEATFKMGGSAVIAENNDVYLPSGAKITITEAFDGDIACAAVITPEVYDTTTSVLEIDTNSNASLENEYDVFKVSPQQVDDTTIEYWTVDETGKLAVTCPYSLINNSAYWSFEETIAAIQEAEGETSIIIYPLVSTAELGKAVTEDSLLYEVKQNSNASFTITIKSFGDNKLTLPEDSSYMFAECDNITAVSLEGVDSSVVTNLSHMFERCTSLSSINIGTSFTNTNTNNFDYMFSECTGFTEIDLCEITSFSSSSSFNYMFNGCSNVKFIYIYSGTSWYFDTNEYVTCYLTGTNMFLGCTALRYSMIPSMDEGQAIYDQNKVGVEMAKPYNMLDANLGGYFCTKTKITN